MSSRSAALTASALRAVPEPGLTVLSHRALAARGTASWDVRRQLEAGRWQRFGRAIVLHNGPLDASEQREVALLSCGPRSVLTSFTSLGVCGLQGWPDPQIHVLAPVGVASPRELDLPIVLHRTSRPIASYAGRRVHRPAAAAVLAGASFAGPRAAVGLLAAAVQQRLVRPDQLRSALDESPRVRHRHALRQAVADIAMGAQALSEIDFVTLCRRAGLPEPRLQAVRVERGGRRRYLDAEWTLPAGRRLVAEIDGALHLAPRRWFDDQLRQNEITLSGSLVLRYPSVVVRTEPALVIGQLRSALRPR